MDRTARRVFKKNGNYALVDACDYSILSRLAWHLTGNGTAQHSWRYKGQARNTAMHHLIKQPPDGMVIDHINGNPADNCRCNLRICSKSINQQNQQCRRPPTPSNPYQGVAKAQIKTLCYIRAPQPQYRQKPYTAQIRKDGRVYHLGSYDTAESAARAYDAKARELYGPHAYVNFPDEFPKPPTPPHGAPVVLPDGLKVGKRRLKVGV